MTGERPLVTVLVVNYNTAPFIEATLDILSRITANPYRVSICDNGSRWLDRWRLRRAVRRHPEASVRFRTQTGPSSQGHGEGLNILAEDVRTPYMVFLDADATFLAPDWDERLLERLDETVRVVGAPPVPNPTKPTDFPSVYATLVDTDVLRELDVDMRPEDPAAGKDTGWELRENVRSSEYEAACLTTRNTRTYKKGPFSDMLCAEFYLEGYDGVFASHFGRGATLGSAKYFKGSLLQLPVIGTLPRRLRGYRERRRWIDRCRRLVAERTAETD